MRVGRIGLALVCVGITIACNNNPETNTSPTAPTGAGGRAAPDGSTLKASIPAPVSPTGGARVDTRRPALAFTHAVGTFVAAAYTYRIELFEGAALANTFTLPQGAGAQSTFTPDADLKADTVYRWRVRAELLGGFTAYSAPAEFRTPAAPSGGGGSVGPTRQISFNEAFAIILAVHDGERWNLGSSSTRETRVAFWFRAVGIIHYGHPAFNPLGGDPDWCVKDAGGGRPPSDDVLVRCSTRDAWDLIGGAGANGYSFHQDFLGRLPAGQNVYPPPVPDGGGGPPPDPNRPPLPDRASLVRQLANEFPALLQNSCNTGGGTWQFLDLVVDRLRAEDPRWGYNGKRGDVTNPAGDEVAYHWGSDTRQGSPNVYLVDVIESHCGAVPRTTWRPFSNEPGAWVSRGRF